MNGIHIYLHIEGSLSIQAILFKYWNLTTSTNDLYGVTTATSGETIYRKSSLSCIMVVNIGRGGMGVRWEVGYERWEVRICDVILASVERHGRPVFVTGRKLRRHR